MTNIDYPTEILNLVNRSSLDATIQKNLKKIEGDRNCLKYIDFVTHMIKNMVNVGQTFEARRVDFSVNFSDKCKLQLDEEIKTNFNIKPHISIDSYSDINYTYVKFKKTQDNKPSIIIEAE